METSTEYVSRQIYVTRHTDDMFKLLSQKTQFSYQQLTGAALDFALNNIEFMFYMYTQKHHRP